MNTRLKAGRERGYALLVAIFLSVVLGLVAVGVQTTTRTDLRDGLLQRARLRAEFAAESGIIKMLDTLRTSQAPAQVSGVAQALVEAECSAQLRVPAPELVAAYLPGQATEGVYLIESEGRELQGNRTARAAMLVRLEGRPPFSRVDPLMWLAPKVKPEVAR